MRFEITSTPGYNRKEFGQHPTELNFLLHGEEGTLVWRLSTGISPKGHYPSMDSHGPLLEGVNLSSPMSFGLVTHSELTDKNADAVDYNINDKCEYRNGRACVCDYSRASTPEITQAFACEGIPGVERELRKVYLEHYGVEE